MLIQGYLQRNHPCQVFNRRLCDVVTVMGMVPDVIYEVGLEESNSISVSTHVEGKMEVNWVERHTAWIEMWGQRRYRQPLREPVMPGRTVANGYMQWFYKNGKPFILSAEERTRVIPGPRPEQPRQQRDPRSIGASTGSKQMTRALSTSVGPVPTLEGPSTEPYTSMPPVFSNSSGSQFHFTMAPPMEGFFVGAFQPYISMMSAPSHAPRKLFPSPYPFQKSVAPLAVFPPQGPDFCFTYGMVQNTPPGSLFASDPSGSGRRDDNEDEDDAEADEDDDDDDTAVRRNP
ncbi:hypothetical protein V6N13_081184 [Hibiscus sabdariffa]